MKGVKELFFLLCLAFLVRLPWLLMIPQVEAPDENTHLWVIEFIAKNFHLPGSDSIMNSGPQAVYGSIPQFGYLPHILFYKVFQHILSANTIFYAARLGSLFMGLILVAAAYFIGRILFLPHHISALAVPLIIVFHPQFVFVTSYTNNDSTCAALSALILLILIVGLRRGLNTWLVLSLSICSSLLALSKYSGYSTLLLIALVLPVIVYLHKQRLKQQIVLFVLLALLTLMMTTWWFTHNYFEFNGDITGVKTMHKIWSFTYHKHLKEFETPLAILFTSSFWRMLFFSFWGWFGYMTRSLPRVIYYTYLLFVIVSIVRFADSLVDKIHKNKFDLPKQIKDLFILKENIKSQEALGISESIQWTRNWAWVLILGCFILNFSMCVYGLYSGVAGPQGRYLFPSEVSIIAMLVAGLSARYNKWSQTLVLTFIAFNFVVYCYASYYLLSLYGHG